MVFGAVKWKVCPSRSSACISATSASTTKSTGTMLVRPVSGSTIGVNFGNLASLRQHPEEVVGAVDLVHFAGAGIADDHRGPVHAIPQSLGRADQQFGFELRLVIRRRQILRDVEVVLGVLAAVGARHRDRRHMVQRRIEPTSQVDHRTGALDVCGALLGLTDGDVVDRGAMHDMVDGAEFGDGVVGEPEVGRGEVADQRFRSFTPLAWASRSNLASDSRRTSTHTSASPPRARICDTTRRPINPVPPVTT